jgi:predicted MFS family arabinose efflux permease
MAIGSGIAVANLYYIQPLLADMGRAFAVSPSAMGGLVTLTQVGFAIGMLLLVPLGDIGERRRLILLTLSCTAACLAAVALATSYAWIAVAIFFVGAFSVTPQMYVPFAAHLAAADRRGHAVGVVMSGLLVGILASRAVSGFLGAAAGWRAVFWFGAALTIAMAVVSAVSLPTNIAASRVSYSRLLASLWHFTRRERVLRESALSGAMLFGSFSAFWSMLAFRLETPPLHYGSRAAGVFSLLGVAGAAAAPMAGRLADRLDPRTNVKIALSATAGSFVLFALGGATIAGLVVGVILFDVAIQAGHVTNLSRIHALSPDARNRMTTVYMVSFFLGGAAGSALAGSAWQRWQWIGVCVVGFVMPLVALAAMYKSEA